MKSKRYTITLSDAAFSRLVFLGGGLSRGVELASHVDLSHLGALMASMRDEINPPPPEPAALTAAQKAEQKAEADKQAKFDAIIRATPVAVLAEKLDSAKAMVGWCAERGRDDTAERKAVARCEQALARRRELFPGEVPEPTEPTIGGRTTIEWQVIYNNAKVAGAAATAAEARAALDELIELSYKE